MSANAIIENGSYHLPFSMTAIRGECQYHIISIYLAINSKNVYELISMAPENLVQRSAEIALLNIGSISPIYCDYAGVADKDCSIDSAYATYDFSTSSKRIVLDLKDDLEKPAQPNVE